VGVVHFRAEGGGGKALVLAGRDRASNSSCHDRPFGPGGVLEVPGEPLRFEHVSLANVRLHYESRG
jgi:hypothetical protein